MISFSCIPFQKFKIDDLSNLKRKKISTINNEYIYNFHKDPRIKKIILNSINVFDGSYPFYFSKIYSKNNYQNYITGIDLIHYVYNNFGKFKSVTFIGGSNLANHSITKIFKNKGFTVKNWCGYVSNDGSSKIKQEIFNSDAIFVALGCKKQEFFIEKNLINIKNYEYKFISGIGGAFDIFLEPKYLPKVIHKLGLGPVWRLLMEPRVFRLKRIFTSIYSLKYYLR